MRPLSLPSVPCVPESGARDRAHSGFERFSAHNPLHALLSMIGGTPLIELRVRWRGKQRRVFAKVESFNFTGSVKDRMAAWVLAEGWERGAWRPGCTIVEASSGNTAIALAALGRALGSPVRIFMPDWMSTERVQILSAFGAELVQVSAAQGGFLGSIERAARAGRDDPDVFLPDQFGNQANLEAHACTTGPEILAQLELAGLEPELFVAGVGTGGTIMGVGRTLRESQPDVRLHPLEPAESPILSTGKRGGHHRIQGISDEFVPALVDLSRLDRPVAVHDGDALLASAELARRMGLGVGISSGANLLGALLLQEELGGDAVAVTIFADSHKKYLTTDLFRRLEPQPGWITPELEFLGWRAIGTANR